MQNSRQSHRFSSSCSSRFICPGLVHQTPSNRRWNYNLGSSMSIDQMWFYSTPTLARRTFSDFWSFKIRRTMFLHRIKFASLLIARLWNCDKAGRETTDFYFHSTWQFCASLNSWFSIEQQVHSVNSHSDRRLEPRNLEISPINLLLLLLLLLLLFGNIVPLNLKI